MQDNDLFGHTSCTRRRPVGPPSHPQAQDRSARPPARRFCTRPRRPVVCPSADPAGPSRTRGVRHGRRGKAEICPRAQYVGYTATPFANVFVDPDDETRPVSRRLRPLAAPTARLHGSPGVPPRAGDWSCRCRRKLLGRGTSTPCIPMVGADAASGSTGWKIPAPARGFVHIRSHFL